MKRILILTLVFLISATIVRDESWTTAGYAAMLADLDRLQEPLMCDCDNPSPECREPCVAELNSGFHCGTPLIQKIQRLREALIRGDRPDVVKLLSDERPELVREVVFGTHPAVLELQGGILMELN